MVPAYVSAEAALGEEENDMAGGWFAAYAALGLGALKVGLFVAQEALKFGFGKLAVRFPSEFKVINLVVKLKVIFGKEDCGKFYFWVYFFFFCVCVCVFEGQRLEEVTGFFNDSKLLNKIHDL